MLFTIVTVIFLPLSFVASYISMSGGTTDLDWDGLQGLFWKVASPLAVVIAVFCFGVVKFGLISHELAWEWLGSGDWGVCKGAWRKGREGRDMSLLRLRSRRKDEREGTVVMEEEV